MKRLTRRTLVITCGTIASFLLVASFLAPLTYLVGLAFGNPLTTFVESSFPAWPYPVDRAHTFAWVGFRAIMALVMAVALWYASRGFVLLREYIRVGTVQGVREALQDAAKAQSAEAEAARKANEEELGTLISISVHPTKPLTLVETDLGFYSIRGVPTKVLKGSVIRRIGRDLVLDHGQGNTQRYPLFAE